MKALTLFAAATAGVAAGLDAAGPQSTVIVEQTTTSTATTVYFVTIKPGLVTGDGSSACSVSGCGVVGKVTSEHLLQLTTNHSDSIEYSIPKRY